MSRIARLVVLFGFAGVVAFVVGLLLFQAPLEYGLDCDRFAGRCTFTQRLMIGSRVGAVPIAALDRAQVRVVPQRRGAARIMVWVRGRSGRRDCFFADYSRRADAAAAAGKINAFLADPTDGRLVLTRSVRGMYWLGWLLVPVVAALVVALASILFPRKGRAGSKPVS